MDRNTETMMELEGFVKAALKKAYKLNLSKIYRKTNYNDFTKNIKNNKTYFCSELCASVYKNMGILP
jgi:uncharacterized protein YycO